MSNIIGPVNAEKNILMKMKAKVKRSLANAPEGSLMIYKRRDRFEFYNRLPDTPDRHECRVYIKKDNIELVTALAQKDYDMKVLNVLESAIKALDNFSSRFPVQKISCIYEQLNEEQQKYVRPIIPTDEQYIKTWQNTPYASKGFRADDNSNYYTERDERVRSKSEVIIANALYHAGIPYKYEYPLELEGHVIYPDFIILDICTRTEVIFEHFGMIDTSEYAQSFVYKMSIYERKGIFPGRNLIFTVESSTQPLDTRILKKVIDEYFFKQQDSAEWIHNIIY